MNKPNRPLPAINLAQYLHTGELAPLWVNAVYGSSHYTPAHLLCPVCGSDSLYPPHIQGDELNDATSVFLPNDECYSVDFHRSRVVKTVNEGLSIMCIMLHLRCANGHNAVLNIDVEPGGGTTLDVQIDDKDYELLYPDGEKNRRLWEGEVV